MYFRNAVSNVQDAPMACDEDGDDAKMPSPRFRIIECEEMRAASQAIDQFQRCMSKSWGSLGRFAKKSVQSERCGRARNMNASEGSVLLQRERELLRR
jgi:hypothetical protein